jgi:hypothetical protein
MIWHFRFGFFSDLSDIKRGFIRQIAPVYKQEKEVTVTLYDTLLNLSTKSSGKNWGRVSSSTIAKAIAKQHGLLFAGDDSKDIPKKAWVQPSDMNDVRFLRDLAAMTDFEVFVDGVPPTLFFRKKPYGKAPKARLIYYDDPTENSYVLEFAPKVKSLGPIQAGVTGTNSDKGKGDKMIGDDVSHKTPSLSVYLNYGDHGVAGSSIGASSSSKKDVSNPAPSNVSTKALVDTWRQQMFDKANEAHSRHPLTPSITAGDIFEWGGLERQLNGKWYAFEEHHEIHATSNQTSIVWKRNATGQGTKKADNVNNTQGNTAPDQVAFVYSTHGVGNVAYVPRNTPAPALRGAE